MDYFTKKRRMRSRNRSKMLENGYISVFRNYTFHLLISNFTVVQIFTVINSLMYQRMFSIDVRTCERMTSKTLVSKKERNLLLKITLESHLFGNIWKNGRTFENIRVYKVQMATLGLFCQKWSSTLKISLRNCYSEKLLPWYWEICNVLNVENWLKRDNVWAKYW